MTVDDPNKPRHLLYDHDLKAFEDLSSDKSLTWFLALGAIALPLTQNLYNLFCDLRSSKIPDVFDAAMCLLFCAAATGAVIKGLEYRRTHPKLVAKITEIQNRKTVSVDVSKLR
jgi:hypothetical protein